MGKTRQKSGHPGLLLQIGSRSLDHGSLLRFPIIMPFTFSVSISFYTSPLKSAENSCTLMLYLMSGLEFNQSRNHTNTIDLHFFNFLSELVDLWKFIGLDKMHKFDPLHPIHSLFGDTFYLNILLIFDGTSCSQQVKCYGAIFSTIETQSQVFSIPKLTRYYICLSGKRLQNNIRTN